MKVQDTEDSASYSDEGKLDGMLCDIGTERVLEDIVNTVALDSHDNDMFQSHTTQDTNENTRHE